MYALFYSKYSKKCMDIIHNMDEESKKMTRLISIDSPEVRNIVKKYIKEVPCLVIKENGKLSVYKYDILFELYPKNDISDDIDFEDDNEQLCKLQFSGDISSTTPATKKDPKKLDMSTVQEEMKRREDELKAIDNIKKPKPVLSNSVKKSNMMSQYETIKPDPSATASTSSINDFFNYTVSDDRL